MGSDPLFLRIASLARLISLTDDLFSALRRFLFVLVLYVLHRTAVGLMEFFGVGIENVSDLFRLL